MSTALAFSANYRRFTPQATDLLMRISTSLGAIRGARVLPAVADQLRASAKAGTVHFSNLIEGNELPFVEAERATRGELSPDTRAKIELVNYVAALDLLDDRVAAGPLSLDPTLLRELHATLTRGLGRDDDPCFKPHHEGAWRDGVAVVVDRMSGQVMHTGPPPAEVPARVQAMFDWLQRRLQPAAEPVFVLAGVVHYGITDIHPFADGNGRAARLMQTAILMSADALPGRMFSFERFYAEDRGAYYEALRSVRRNTLNMEVWLEYFLTGLAEEYDHVAATVSDLSLLVAPKGTPLRLSATQQRALAALRSSGLREFSRREYEEASGLARTAASSEIAELIQHGILLARGASTATRYAFVAPVPRRPGQARRGRKPRWTEGKIEAELRAFLEGRSSWPSARDFRAAGKADLYAAASRHGSIRRWRNLFGL
jgi:Fic family protein